MSSEYGMRPLLQLFALLLAGLVVGSMVQLYLLGDTPPDAAAVEKPLLLLTGMMCFQLCTFALPALIWSRLHPHSFLSTGQTAITFQRIVILLLFFGSVFFFANELNYWTIRYLTESGSSLVNGLNEQLVIYQALFTNGDLLWFNLLVFGLVPAISEELFFRGIVFNYLKSKLNSFIHAALISSLFFAGMHMQIAQFIPIFILGFALAVVYHITGKIWLAMLLHAANNSIQVLALMQQKEFSLGGLWIILPFFSALFLYRAISTWQKSSK